MRKLIFVLSLGSLWTSSFLFSTTDSSTQTTIISAPCNPSVLSATAIIEIYDQNKMQGIVRIERGKAPFGLVLPNGKVEYGETVEPAVRREMREEVNLELENLKQFHVHSDPDRDFRHHTVEVTHLAKSEMKPIAGDDAAKDWIFSLDQIPGKNSLSITRKFYAIISNRVIEILQNKF